MSILNKFQALIGFEEQFDRFHIDPLYGAIGITKEESKVIQSEDFQRLKYIRQLGLVHHFYHSATHTRYEHSLGVLHTTWTLFKRVFNNFEKDNHNYSVERGILENLADYKIIQALRLAGLCHDVGHGPLSHTFENISKEICPSLPDHDQITYDILKKNKFGLDKDINQLVLSIVNPDKEPLQGKQFGEYQFFLHDIVWGDLGSDRIDYLLRDTYMTGLSHRFGLSHLLDSITAIFDPDMKRLYLSVEASMRDAVFYFLTTRFYHFQLLANFQKNVELEAEFKMKLKEHIEKIFGTNQTAICQYLEDLNKCNDNELMNTLNYSERNKIEELASWTLDEIHYPLYRFFIYRFSYDRHLRAFYEETIRKYIDEKESQPVADKLIFYFNIQKGRVPAIPVTLQKYSKEHLPSRPGGQVRIYHLPTLLHEFSPLLQGVAETYLINTKVSVFAERFHNIRASLDLRTSPSFLSSANIINDILERCSKEVIQTSSKIEQCDRLDFLLLFIKALTELKGVSVFHRFSYIQNLVKRVQQEVIDNSNGKPPYSFRVQDYFYNPSGSHFHHQNVLYNDIFLLKISKLLEIGDRQYYWPRYHPDLPKINYARAYLYKINMKMLDRILKYYFKFSAYQDLLSKIQNALSIVFSSKS